MADSALPERESERRMTPQEAVAEILEYASPWDYDEQSGSTCFGCGWSSKRGPWPMPNRVGLAHLPGCKLEEAFAVATAWVAQHKRPDTEGSTDK